VTYFFNGNRTGKFSQELEEYVEIPSDRVPFEQRPWMKAAEITDRVIDAVKSGDYDFIRLNYPNGDMVGHTGIYPAVVCAMEALDLCLGRLIKAVKEAGAVLVVSADHGNSDDMYQRNKKKELVIKEDGTPQAKTSHSLNPVPCIVFDPEGAADYKPVLREGMGISSLAATCIELLGFNPPEDYDPSVLLKE
jgi:2,3-bisphosphoglycerate-independent phosphoglycerate mutase